MTLAAGRSSTRKSRGHMEPVVLLIQDPKALPSRPVTKTRLAQLVNTVSRASGQVSSFDDKVMKDAKGCTYSIVAATPWGILNSCVSPEKCQSTLKTVVPERWI